MSKQCRKNHNDTSAPEKGIPTNTASRIPVPVDFLRQLDKQVDLVREGVTWHLSTYGAAARCDCLRTGELLDCDDILNAYIKDSACPDSLKPLIRKCANNTVYEDDHEDALYYAGELQIAIENLLEGGE